MTRSIRLSVPLLLRIPIAVGDAKHTGEPTSFAPQLRWPVFPFAAGRRL